MVLQSLGVFAASDAASAKQRRSACGAANRDYRFVGLLDELIDIDAGTTKAKRVSVQLSLLPRSPSRAASGCERPLWEISSPEGSSSCNSSPP